MTQSAKEAVAIIKKLASGFVPKVGMILGSGLGAISSQIEDAVSISYADLPNFSVNPVAGHGSKLHLGILKGVPVACLEGRTHLYEGGIAVEVIKTLIRTLKLLGCEILLTTNAVGSLLLDVPPGHLVLVKDQMNFMFDNPLIGKNDDEFGPRFVSMDNAYDANLRKRMLQVAQKINIPLREAVYLASSGPTFETHAEIHAYKTLGADVVGMSTVPETILARHCGLRVVTVSAVTNFAAGLSSEILSHEGTLRGAALAIENLVKLFLAFLAAGVE
jgi:xanthosine phosphorylase